MVSAPKAPQLLVLDGVPHLESRQALPRLGVPDLARLVAGGGEDLFAVATRYGRYQL